MLLCDIGNTNITIYDQKKLLKYKALPKNIPSEEFFYINVNYNLINFLQTHPNAINIAPHIEINSNYKGLGIDRACLVFATENGIVVDAGSAITIDIVKNNFHLGGYILPGIANYKKIYHQISPALKTDDDIDLNLDLDKIPNETKSAINVAILLPIIDMIRNLSVKFDLPIITAGGDGEIFKSNLKDKFSSKNKLTNSVEYDPYLIFKGMEKGINKYYERIKC